MTLKPTSARLLRPSPDPARRAPVADGANLGDSRAVLVRLEGSREAVGAALAAAARPGIRMTVAKARD